MSFEYADLETGELVRTDEPLVFWNYLRAKAAREVQAWHSARLGALAERHMLGELKDTVEYIEASARLSEQIDGANAETRKAQLEHLLGSDAEHRAAVQRMRDSELRREHFEIEAEAAHSRFRVTLRDLEVLAAMYSPQERGEREYE